MAPNSVLSRPMQPMELMVLTVLFDDSHHGYGLVRAIEERTSHSVRVRPGNLYRVLDRLVDAGLLTESEVNDGPSGGADRTRSFSITKAGRTRVINEAETLGRALGASPDLRNAIERGLESTP